MARAIEQSMKASKAMASNVSSLAWGNQVKAQLRVTGGSIDPETCVVASCRQAFRPDEMAFQ
jgi:hypothetical protein